MIDEQDERRTIDANSRDFHIPTLDDATRQSPRLARAREPRPVCMGSRVEPAAVRLRVGGAPDSSPSLSTGEGWGGGGTRRVVGVADGPEACCDPDRPPQTVEECRSRHARLVSLAPLRAATHGHETTIQKLSFGDMSF